MNKATFKILFKGPAVDDFSIDARDLAPALLAAGGLFEEANRVLNGERASVHLRVRAHTPGSFGVELELVQPLIQQAIELFSGPTVTAVANIVALVGGAGSAGGGLLWLIKKLRGRKPDAIIDQKNGMVKITHGATVVEIPNDLVRLYFDYNVRKAAEQLSKPLETAGIDSISILDDAGQGEVIEKADVSSFTVAEPEDEQIIEKEGKAAFSIISLSFKEDNKWRLHDGNTSMLVAIKDADFLGRVDRNLVSFSKGDILICDVITRQFQTAKGLSTEHEVVKVLEHKPAARQLKLF